MSTSGCSVHRGDIMMHVGDIMSTLGDTMSTSGDIMMHVGEQVGKSLSISIENPDVLSIPQCTEHPPMYSWHSPRCTHGIPPDVLMVFPPMY